MSTVTARIPDNAFVIREGKNRPEDIQRGTGTHPSGTTGVSVESAEGVSVAGKGNSVWTSWCDDG